MHKTKNIGAKLFLKAHYKNGDVCILRNSWKVDTVQNTVSGTGTLYDFNREITFQGKIEIPIDSIAIFETNKKITGTETGRLAGLYILAGVDIAVGIYCITNPKACFGSCPTFYKNENDNFHFADAEGFSSAVSPSMEYADTDALNNRHLSDHKFTITMKNEALETHCVRDVKLLAYPRNEGERIYHTAGDDFYLCEKNYHVSSAAGAEGDITDLIRNEDMRERFSVSDENNLSSKEEIILNFDSAENYINPGLVIHFRQTLMTTYFIYSAMGYMGDEIGDYFAKMEVNNEIVNKLNGGIKKELGGIDVFVLDENKNKWIKSGSLFETGPIAVNKQMLPLKIKAGSSDIKVKLVLNKGLWRIDFAALTDIKEKVKPLEISPDKILNKGKQDDAALALINDTDKHLISMPGSEYKFYFSLPEQYKDYELFLYSKGYYLEWMREHWIKEKDLLKLNQMIEHPVNYLRSQAKDYKIYEATMELEFWNSKIDTKNFSYHEN